MDPITTLERTIRALTGLQVTIHSQDVSKPRSLDAIARGAEPGPRIPNYGLSIGDEKVSKAWQKYLKRNNLTFGFSEGLVIEFGKWYRAESSKK